MSKDFSLKTLVESQHSDPYVARQLGAAKLIELNDKKEITPRDYSMRELIETFISPDTNEAIAALRQWGKTGNPVYRTLTEAIDVSAFDKIQGNIILNEMRIGWGLAPNLLSSRVKTQQTSLAYERIPGYGLMKEYGYKVSPGEKGGRANFSQWYTETANIEKTFLMCDVTWEALFYDRLGQILDRARYVGERLALGKEKRIAGCLAGVNVTLDGQVYTANNYNLRKSASVGGAFNTYSTSTQTTAGVSIVANALASTPIVDEVAIESLAQLATEMVHPDTGDRLNVRSELKDLFVMPAKRQTVERFTSAREVRSDTQSAAFVTYGPRDRVLNQYNLIVSDVLYGVIIDSGIAASAAKQWYFLNNLEKGIVYMQNRALDVEVAPAMGDAAFEQDLVYRVRAIEMGVPQSLGPWYMYKGYDS